MRVIAGKFRGRALASVGKGDPKSHLRPTTDRTRESLFNILEGGRFGQPIDDAIVLDLFAGTGALSIEAISRGAAQATLVENGRAALSLIQRNLADLGLGGQCEVLRTDARRLPPRSGAQATLVFLDPPYSKNLAEPALAAAMDSGWIAPNALIVVEDQDVFPASETFTHLDTRKMGAATFSFLEPTG